MRILEGREPVLKVFIDDEDEIAIGAESGETIFLSPLEADRLADLLKSIYKKTKYSKGFRKDGAF